MSFFVELFTSQPWMGRDPVKQHNPGYAIGGKNPRISGGMVHVCRAKSRLRRGSSLLESLRCRLSSCTLRGPGGLPSPHIETVRTQVRQLHSYLESKRSQRWNGPLDGPGESVLFGAGVQGFAFGGQCCGVRELGTRWGWMGAVMGGVARTAKNPLWPQIALNPRFRCFSARKVRPNPWRIMQRLGGRTLEARRGVPYS